MEETIDDEKEIHSQTVILLQNYLRKVSYDFLAKPLPTNVVVTTKTVIKD